MEQILLCGRGRAWRSAGLAVALFIPSSAWCQLLSNTGSSGSVSTVSDSANYTPMTGGQVVVDSNFSTASAAIGSLNSSSHGFSNLIIPGVGGLTSASESSSILSGFTNGATSASYSTSLAASATISTSVTGAGADRDVNAASSSTARDTFDFSLSGDTLVTISGMANFDGGALSSVQLVLDNLTTNTTVTITAGDGSFTSSALLGPGDYDLVATVNAGAGFDYNAFQGAILNDPGSFNERLNYTASFTQPAPTPETSTTMLGLIGSLCAARLGFRSRRP